MTQKENNDMINPLLSEADFFWQTTEIWLNKVEKNIKKVLTGNWRHDIISELLMQMKKNLKNKIKKFLTKQKASDIINELSAERRRQTTLITKQWNTYDSRKFFTFLRTVWKTKTVKREIASCYLEWIKHFIREFDPGSGWTLAACLTHASRTGNISLRLRWIWSISSGGRVSNAWVTCLIQGDNSQKWLLIPHKRTGPHGLVWKTPVV